MELEELRLGRVSSMSGTEEDVASVDRSPVFERHDLCDEDEASLLLAEVMEVMVV